MADHPMFAEDMQEIVESFIVETGELFDGLDHDLLQLEQNPTDTVLVDKIFRAVHNVKGTAGFLSFEPLSYLTHHFESVLNRLRSDELVFHPAMMDVMLHAVDLMKALRQQVVDRHLTPLDLDPVLRRLASLLDDGNAHTPAQAATETAAGQASLPASPESDDGLGPEPTLRPSADRGAETIRVDVERLDSLMNLVGELVLGRNRLLQLTGPLADSASQEQMRRELTETSAQIDFITSELQTAVMRTRMVQIGQVFRRFPRVVRDLARNLDKDITLVVEGEENELDKSLIEEISAPLVHLIRNACDHGIEAPDVRRAAGKPPQGTLRLAAWHEGNTIVIVVEDDGGGIDPVLLKQKALENGLIAASDAAAMSDTDACHLVFLAGLSTADTVTEVSGRGVGMDVVRSNIARLNGTISIHSERGIGSRFTLKFPLTVAIVQSLLVQVAAETYALPLHSVREVIRLTPAEIRSMNGREVIRLRDDVLPLLRIDEVLQVPQPIPASPAPYAVVLSVGHRQFGLVVDGLIGQKEIVIKPPGTYLNKVPGIAGSTIPGDGRVIMILDDASHCLDGSQREGSRDQRGLRGPDPLLTSGGPGR